MGLIRDICEHMSREGIRQADVARLIDRHPGHISRTLAEGGNPRLADLIEIADAVGLKIIAVPHDV